MVTRNLKYACLITVMLAGCFVEPPPNQSATDVNSTNDSTATNTATEETHQGDVVAKSDVQQTNEIEVGTTFVATYVSNASGKTVVIDAPQHGRMTVFLYGVASPKDGEPGFVYARDSLKRLLQGNELTVRVRKISENGAVAVDLKIPAAAIYGPDRNGVNLPPIRINGRIVQSGAGRYDESEAPGDGQLHHAQEIAQSKRLGIWSDANSVDPK